MTPRRVGSPGERERRRGVEGSAGLLAHWGAALVGARFAARVPGAALQRGFAVLILLLAAFTLVRSLLAW